MSRHIAARAVVLVLVATGILGGPVLPASATPSSFDLEDHSSRIGITRFGVTTNFDTPGTSVAACPGTTTITGTVEDAGGTDTVGATLSISSPFSFGTGTYILTASGTSAGTDRGNYTGGATGTFSSLSFPGTTFNISTLNPTTCVAGTRVCGSAANPGTSDGSLNLTATGGVTTGSTIPLSGGSTTDELDGEKVFVNATGSFLNAGCISTSPFWFFIVNGAAIRLGDNPNDCYLNGGLPPPCTPGGPDPGAIFTQQP